MILVVGAGISGATIAYKFASAGKEVLVIDKRDHIGGNCYDFINEYGLIISKYGPHFFHTNDKGVWDFINQFSEWLPYEHRVLSFVDNKLVPIPVNITTVNELFNLNIQNEEEMKEWLLANTEKIENPKNSEESAIARVGRVLYEKMLKNYTKKQWDLYPHELDPQVMNRIPVRTNFDDRYFTDTYQAVPKNGFTAFFNNLLTHRNIHIELGVDYFKSKYKNRLADFEMVFFTGKIDQFFENIINEKLQYRSLKFIFENHNLDYYQSRVTINYPNDYEYTRITEPKHIPGQPSVKGHTAIIKEIPTWDGEPYYPVFNQRNNEIYSKYQKLAKDAEKSNIFFVGRLANYKYFNMDAAFRNAIDIADALLK